MINHMIKKVKIVYYFRKKRDSTNIYVTFLKVERWHIDLRLKIYKNIEYKISIFI